MNHLYFALGTSKQSVHQKLDRYLKRLEGLNQLYPLIVEIREEHPEMSLRHIYRLINPAFIGRDAFEEYFKEEGFSIKKVRNYRRTTNSLGVTRFPNLLIEVELNDINQCWVSDITYYQIKDEFFYLTFIMDLYSRKVIGYSCSSTLYTEQTTIPALKMALKIRDMTITPNTIIHSDGGGQYYSKQFLQLTKKSHMQNSMGKVVYDNPHAERVNGIIKNSYLRYYNPNNHQELKQMLKRAVNNYNSIKPHSSLNRLSPDNFELSIQKKYVQIKKIKLIILPLKRSTLFRHGHINNS